MRTSEKTDLIMPELVGLYEELDNLVKDADNPFYKSKYVQYDTVNEYTRPLLSARGLWMNRGLNEAGDQLVTRVWHKSGQWVESSVPYFEPRAQTNKDGRLIEPTAQDAMKSLSYSMRYGHFAALGMVPKNEDDDGNQASRKKKKEVKHDNGWFTKGDGKVLYPNTHCKLCGVLMPQGAQCEIAKINGKWANRHPGGQCEKHVTGKPSPTDIPPAKNTEERQSPSYQRFSTLCAKVREATTVEQVAERQRLGLADMRERDFPEHLVDGYDKMCNAIMAKMKRAAKEGA